LITRIYRELKKVNCPRNQEPYEEMGISTAQSFFKGRNPNNQKTKEEMLKIPGYKGKENQNHVKIQPFSC
jgi:hypothetical protein